ncbi:hypothetical protein HII36_16210 [Nonomuraea sp. NN258]|uniref:hypothetical protein n=1 Tax=Nonomuraea antri TaxID=2730852 RepID=UPI00156927D7|nr:hypothetical protein [Nonomuraea antri]NRQ33379.1 hypothetical protein [Nonomuraea antri]
MSINTTVMSITKRMAALGAGAVLVAGALSSAAAAAPGTSPVRSKSAETIAPKHTSGWYWSTCTGDGNQGIQGRLSGAWAGPHKVASRKRVTINYSFARVSDFQTCRHGSGGVKARKIVMASAFYIKGSKFSCDTITLAGQGGSSVTCTFSRGTAVFRLKKTCAKATMCRIRTGTMHVYADGGARIKSVRMQVSSRIYDHQGENTYWNTPRF